MSTVNLDEIIRDLINKDPEQTAQVSVDTEQGVEDGNVRSDNGQDAGVEQTDAGSAADDPGTDNPEPNPDDNEATDTADQAASKLDRISEQVESDSEGDNEGGEQDSSTGEETSEDSDDESGSEDTESTDEQDSEEVNGGEDADKLDTDDSNDDLNDDGGSVADDSNAGAASDVAGEPETTPQVPETGEDSDDVASPDVSESDDSTDQDAVDPESDDTQGSDDAGDDTDDTQDDNFSDQGEIVEEAKDQADGGGEDDDDEDDGEDDEDESQAPGSELEKAQATIEDAQEISERLAQVAKIITDRFPEAQESAGFNSNDPVLRMAQVSIESIQDQAQALLGPDVRIDEEDPAITGVRKGLEITKANLVNANEALTALGDLRAQLTQIKELATKTKPGPVGHALNPEVLKALNSNGVFDVSALNAAGVYGRVAATLKHWVKDSFVEGFLYDLIKDGQATPPKPPYLADLNRNNVRLTDRLVATFKIHKQDHTRLLPGNHVLTYWLDVEQEKDSGSGREGCLRLAYLSPEQPLEETGRVQLANCQELQQLQTEYTTGIEALVAFSELVQYLDGVVTAFENWLDKADSDELRALAINVLLSVNAPVVDLTLVCLNYVKALGTYCLLEAA